MDDNSYISDWWILTGELIEPIIMICSNDGKDFFEIGNKMNDYDQDEFCRTCGFHLYIPDPPNAGSWYCENPNCPDCDESVFEREELEKWYGGLDEEY